MDGIHLTTAHDPVDTRIFDKEATTLAESGFDIGIIAHECPSEERNGVRFYDLGTVSTRAERWQSIPRLVRKAKSLDASIYHFHDPELIPVGLFLSETTDGAVIYDVHEDYGHKIRGRDWIPDTVTPLLSQGVPRLERFAGGRFDAIVAATERIGEKFTDVNERVAVVRNFPRTDTLPTIDESKTVTAEHVLCYVGGLEELRGLNRMLSLFETLLGRGLDVELWALGSWGTSEDRYRAERFVSENNLESRTHFPGYLGYEEMFRYLYAGDVGLSLLDTSQFETAIPTKQFEYLYAGLPIVSTNLDAAVRFLPAEYRSIVPQGDTEAAADAVEEMLDNEYDEAAMRSIVEEQYSWESESESLVSLYDELI